MINDTNNVAPTTAATASTEPQTTQTQVADAPQQPSATATTATVQQSDKITSRLARLAQEEAKVAQEKAQIQQLKQEIENSKLSVKDKLDLLENLPSKIKENPDEVLEKLGISFQELTKSILESNDPTAKELRTLQSRLQKMEEELQQERKQKEQRELQLKDQENETIINEYKSGVFKHIDENPEKYELIRSTGMQDEVWNVITRHYEATKELLTEKQASEYVESFLEESQLKKFYGTKKFSRLLEGNRSSGDRTLSSSVASSNVGTVENTLTDDQRFEKALGILKNRK